MNRNESLDSSISEEEKISGIIEKSIEGKELSKEELRFLYEIDGKIKTLAYGKDKKIALEEIKAKRNKRKDIAHIFDCKEEEISLTKEEALKGRIKYHYGYLDLSVSESSVDLELPETIVDDLNLGNIVFTKDLKLPKEIRGNLYLYSLIDISNLNFDDVFVGRVVYLPKKTIEESFEKLQNKYQHIKFEKYRF